MGLRQRAHRAAVPQRKSLGTKSFDHKTSTVGADYLETTQCTGDDKTFTGGACPGSYQSPNGSSGKLELVWNVPFAPGRLVAVAKDASGHVVARDEQDTAGRPYALSSPRTRRSCAPTASRCPT